MVVIEGDDIPDAVDRRRPVDVTMRVDDTVMFVRVLVVGGASHPLDGEREAEEARRMVTVTVTRPTVSKTEGNAVRSRST